MNMTRQSNLRTAGDFRQAASATEEEADMLARQLAALGHPARLKILQRLACCDACCCREVVEATHLAQSTVSQHLKVLVEAGLVTYSPERQRSRYALNHDTISALRARVNATLSSCCG